MTTNAEANRLARRDRKARARRHGMRVHGRGMRGLLAVQVRRDSRKGK